MTVKHAPAARNARPARPAPARLQLNGAPADSIPEANAPPLPIVPAAARVYIYFRVNVRPFDAWTMPACHMPQSDHVSPRRTAVRPARVYAGRRSSKEVIPAWVVPAVSLVRKSAPRGMSTGIRPTRRPVVAGSAGRECATHMAMFHVTPMAPRYELH